jgi:hypothetical protein
MGLLDNLGATGVSSNLSGIYNLINQMGGLNNALNQLNQMLSLRGTSARDLALKNLQGKTFSPQVIDQFRTFAKQSGMKDDEIDQSLRELGLIK